ncbi:MAG: filamentous hemagglutinin N-terminal domain-containing protein [Cyanobacteria bacterium P01_F01_bin.143]
MQYKIWLSRSLFFLTTFGCFIPLVAKAQVTEDGTTSTIVNQNGNDFTIEQGDRIGDNLFHSFDEFSVPTLGSAVFNNANDVANIFSRVTGSNISNIDGFLGANGVANLYLINPNGIIFGDNARLNLGGSFFASTADSLLFEGNTEFSASNPQGSPLLEVNIPIGLNFRDNPGNIINRSFVQNDAGDFVGLEVRPGENLTLVGGDISFEGGEATARGGNINLGGLSEAETVIVNDDGTLTFPENVAQADINLINGANVNVSGAGGGNIIINTRNLNLEVGEFGTNVQEGIATDSSSANAKAGNIIIDAIENITVDGGFIANQVNPRAIGNAGDIIINANSLSLNNGGQVLASTFGQGDAGSINITADNSILIDGEQFSEIPSGIATQVNSEAEGDAGNVNITTDSLSLTNGGVVSASTFAQGNAGSVNITANNSISIDGENSMRFPSGVTTQINSEAVGNAGNVNITTDSLSLTNGGVVSASTFAQGNAGSVNITTNNSISIDGENSDGLPSGIITQVNLGAVGDAEDVTITTGSLSLTNGGIVSASTFAQGNAGLVDITARDKVTIDGQQSNGFSSGITSEVNSEAEGNSEGVRITTDSLSLTDGGIISASIRGTGTAGGVRITTDSLSLTNGGEVLASTFGPGNAGSIEITATNNIVIDGEKSSEIPSGIIAQVNIDAIGNAGDIAINTNFLSLTNGGVVSASTFGQGNANSVNITARDNILIDGENSVGFSSGVTSQVGSEAMGDAGDVTITTDSLSLTNGGVVAVSTFGRGDAGSVEITAIDNIVIDGEQSDNFPSGATSEIGEDAVGKAGDVTITTGSLSLNDGGIVSAGTRGTGNAGDVTITTGSLSLTNGGGILASTFGQGNAGSVEITANDTILIDGEKSSDIPSIASSQVNSEAVGNAGGVNITTGSLFLTNGGVLSSSTFGEGNAGSIDIAAVDSIIIIGTRTNGLPSGITSEVGSNSLGNSGNITINTKTLSLDNGGVVSTNIFGQGDSKDIRINIDSLSLKNGGRISASIFDQGKSGLVDIAATGAIIIDGEQSSDIPSGIITQINSNAVGKAGNITVTTNSLSLTNGGVVAASTFGRGDAGLVNITAQDIILIDGENSVGFPSGVSSEVGSDAIGTAGGVTITTGSLSLTNGGIVDVSTFGQGDAGSVNITARDTINIDGEQSDGFPSAATSEVGEDAEGNAQGVTITTGSLSLTNGGLVSASTRGTGNAGPVNITVIGDTLIDGESSEIGSPSAATSQVDPNAVGTAGGVSITTGSLSLTNGGIVSASTFGKGNAGGVNINARELITISGLTANNRSGIFVSSPEPDTGEPGNINIEARTLSLSDEAAVDAVTQSEEGTGANITLQISEDLILRDSSFISAQALEDANGGNLTIDTEFIIAFPNQNNDIIADANRGNGGRIEITAQSLFGIEERLSTPPNQSNDIDASTQFGLQQGSVVFNTPNLDPTSGLIELPEAVGDPSDQVSQNPCEQGVGSEFIVTGKGGLPANPNETLNSNRVRVGLVDPATSGQEEIIRDISLDDSKSEALPAQGWIFNDKGEVMLTSYKTDNTEIRQSIQQSPRTCSSGI